MGQWQASPDVPDVPGLKPGPLGPDTCRRAQPRAAPVVMWGGQVSKHVSGMRVHTSWLLVDDRRSCAWRTRELLTWPWDCTLRARVRQAGSGTRRAQGTGGGTPVRVTGRRCASRLHRTAHTSGSNQTIQPGTPDLLQLDIHGMYHCACMGIYAFTCTGAPTGICRGPPPLRRRSACPTRKTS